MLKTALKSVKKTSEKFRTKVAGQSCARRRDRRGKEGEEARREGVFQSLFPRGENGSAT